MGRTVVLRHDLPDGSHHYDWLIDPSPSEAPGAADGDPDERVLIAWRVGSRPDVAGEDSIAAERLPPHRRLYLVYEGPISGGRGAVARIAEGRAEVAVDGVQRFEVVADFGSGPVRIEGAPGPEGRWEFWVRPMSRP